MKKILLLLCIFLCSIGMWAETETIATMSYTKSGSEVPTGWTATGTGATTTGNYLFVCSNGSITSPSINFDDYSSITIKVTVGRYGSLSGSKATVAAAVGNTTLGSVDGTSTTPSEKSIIVNNNNMPSGNGNIVFTCTNATTTNHGARITNITIEGVIKTSDPYFNDISTVNIDALATNGEFSYTINNPDGSTLVAAEKEDVSWISNVTVDEVNKKVTFDAEPNTGAAREAIITLTYGSLSKDVTIAQAKYVNDFTSLPLVIPAGTSSTNLLNTNGVTGSFDGSDYNNNIAKVKFSKASHYLQIKTSESIGDCSFTVRGCASAGSSSFKLLESSNGIDWTDVETLTATFSEKDEDVQLISTKSFNASSRYIKLAFQKSTGEVNCGLGTFTISKVPVYTNQNLGLVATDADGMYYATFSSSNVTFWPNDVEVDKVSVDGPALTITPLIEKEGYNGNNGYFVPANTGVLIQSIENSATYYTVANKIVATLEDNALIAGTGSTPTDGAEFKYYKLAYDAENATDHSTLGFYWGANDGAPFALTVGKAYLKVAKTASVKSFRFGGNTTGIKTLNNEQSVNKAIKCIINGQLVIEKAGKMYNAAGAEMK